MPAGLKVNCLTICQLMIDQINANQVHSLAVNHSGPIANLAGDTCLLIVASGMHQKWLKHCVNCVARYK